MLGCAEPRAGHDPDAALFEPRGGIFDAQAGSVQPEQVGRFGKIAAQAVHAGELGVSVVTIAAQLRERLGVPIPTVAPGGLGRDQTEDVLFAEDAVTDGFEALAQRGVLDHGGTHAQARQIERLGRRNQGHGARRQFRRGHRERRERTREDQVGPGLIGDDDRVGICQHCRQRGQLRPRKAAPGGIVWRAQQHEVDARAQMSAQRIEVVDPAARVAH